MDNDLEEIVSNEPDPSAALHRLKFIDKLGIPGGADPQLRYLASLQIRR